MDLDRDDYILMLAVSELRDSVNVLISAVRKKDKWLLECRTRAIMDNKAFNSADRKKFMTHELPLETPEDAVESAVMTLHNDTMNIFAIAGGDVKSEVIEIGGDPGVFMEKIKNSQFFSMKKFDKDGKEVS